VALSSVYSSCFAFFGAVFFFAAAFPLGPFPVAFASLAVVLLREALLAFAFDCFVTFARSPTSMGGPTFRLSIAAG
jgi:hypothetical protein